MKFSPGDPVWAYSDGSFRLAPQGEYPAIVKSYYGYFECTDDTWQHFYLIEVPTVSTERAFEIDETSLRPRRDDYQQHEGLGSLDKITEPLDLNERELEVIMTEALEQYGNKTVVKGY